MFNYGCLRGVITPKRRNLVLTNSYLNDKKWQSTIMSLTFNHYDFWLSEISIIYIYIYIPWLLIGMDIKEMNLKGSLMIKVTYCIYILDTLFDIYALPEKKLSILFYSMDVDKCWNHYYVKNCYNHFSSETKQNF